MYFNNFSNYFPFVPLSKNFIENYMTKANPSFVIIYIYALNLAMENKSLDLEKASKDLDLLSSDILKALNYWKEKNLISLENEANNTIIVSFSSSNFEKPIEQKEDTTITIEEPLRKEREKVEELFRLAEKKLAKTLNYTEKQCLIRLYENYDLSSEILAILLTYCLEKGKNNFRYIEKVAIDWCENKIDTIEKAEVYIQFFDNDYKEIFKAFGINYRAPAPVEKVFLKRWILEYKMPIEVIKKACEKTLIKTNNANFEYANSILKNWYENNVNTLDAISKYEEEKAKSYKTNTKNQNKNNSNYTSKFVNYKQKDLDYELLRKIEEKSLM